MKYLFTIISSVVLSVVILGLSQTHACSCMYPGSPAKELEQSEVVFIGVAGSDVSYPFSGESDNLEDLFKKYMIHRTFTIQQGIKGVESDTSIVIGSSEGGFSCGGFAFMTGQQYVVYGSYGNDGVVIASTCGRTSLTILADEDIEFFKTLSGYTLTDDEIVGPTFITKSSSDLWYRNPIFLSLIGLALIVDTWLFITVFKKKNSRSDIE